MASVSATSQLTKRKRTSGRKLLQPLTLEEVAEALQSTRDRTLRRDCLESRDRAYRSLVRRAFADNNLTFKTTITQLAAGMGYPVKGDRRADEQSFGKSVRRCLGDLEAAGLIQWHGVKRPDGAWRCIEVRVLDKPKQRTIMVVMSTRVRDRRFES